MDGCVMSVGRRLNREEGWSLIELLVAMPLMLIVLTATLTSFDAFSNNTRRSTRFNDQQDQVRTTLDRIVRQARNLANPTTGSTGGANTTIAFAAGDRLVFQTTDPSKQWVSYCLNTSTAPSTTTRETIWYQTTANNALTPSAVAGGDMVQGCPSTSTSWQTRKVVGDYVTNQKDSSVNRPLFKYFSASGVLPDPNSTPPFPSDPSRVATSDTSHIVRVNASVFMKLDPSKPPAEAELASAAYMRNQNQPPTASFVAGVSGTTYTFDAGGSDDPEGRTLVYDWYTAPNTVTLATMPSASALPSCSAVNPAFPASATGWTCLGTTVVLTKVLTGTKYVFLRVTDPGGLQTMSAFFPTTGCVSAVDTTRPPTNCGGIP
jgi:type II secretory pathway component PulJ